MGFEQSALAAVESNEDLIELWLYGKSEHTVEAYRRDVNFFKFGGE